MTPPSTPCRSTSDRLPLEDLPRVVDDLGKMPVANIVFPHPPDAVAVARSTEDGGLAVEHVSPGDWLQVGAHLMVGEAPDERKPARIDRALALPLPASLVKGVVKAVDLL